jgi:hypothetical protein
MLECYSVAQHSGAFEVTIQIHSDIGMEDI